jgi:hypothetical protein
MWLCEAAFNSSLVIGAIANSNRGIRCHGLGIPSGIAESPMRSFEALVGLVGGWDQETLAILAYT